MSPLLRRTAQVTCLNAGSQESLTSLGLTYDTSLIVSTLLMQQLTNVVQTDGKNPSLSHLRHVLE